MEFIAMNEVYLNYTDTVGSDYENLFLLAALPGKKSDWGSHILLGQLRMDKMNETN